MKPGSIAHWLVLGGVSVVTVVALGGTIELAARAIYKKSSTTTTPCLVIDDASTGVRGVPNTHCRQKIFESELIQYDLNGCGHRAGMECGPKPEGTFRIVLVGSSFGYGMWTRREQSFAGLLPDELSRRTGRKVDLYNESMQWGVPRSVDRRFSQVPPEQPDVVLWALTPFDVYNVDFELPFVPDAPPSDGATASLTKWQRLTKALRTKSPTEFVDDAWKRALSKTEDLRSVFLLRNLLYRSPSQYTAHFLMDPHESEFLLAEPDPPWLKYLDSLSRYMKDLQARTTAAGARLVVVLVPQRAQAGLIAAGHWPARFDPYAIGEQIRAVTEASGATYVDVLPDFRAVPDAQQYYFPVDGHLDPRGHAIVARMLCQALTDGASPVIASAATGAGSCAALGAAP